MINEDFVRGISIVKDKNGSDFFYTLIYGKQKVGEIKISELSKDNIYHLFSYYPFLEDYLKRTSPIYQISNYGIDNLMRNKGYGKYLLDEVINDFGKYTLILQAGSSNNRMSQEDLVRMYERNGFKVLNGYREYACFMIRKPD